MLWLSNLFFIDHIIFLYIINNTKKIIKGTFITILGKKNILLIILHQ